jgi:putative N6-adenine-specific DNA methylase
VAKHQPLCAICPTWMQPIVMDELEAFGFRNIVAGRGGVYFKGHMGRANRVLGCPSRILWVRGKFKAYDFETLKREVAALDLTPGTGFTIHASSSRSKLYHSDAIKECVASVLPSGSTDLYVRVHRDQVMVSIDTSGNLLYRRGWRLENGPAPVRETIAHALLRFANWQPDEALYDPMCGSGTFLIEAAGISRGLAPNRLRGFACDRWSTPGRALIETPSQAAINGSDADAKVVESALRNAERAGVVVGAECLRAETISKPQAPGLLICNPPYGLRLKKSNAYSTLGRLLNGPFSDWRAGIICPDERSRNALGREPSKRLPFSMGGLGLEFCVFDP